MIGYITSFLTIYGIKISTIQKQEGKHVNKTNYYKIEIIHNVDELLEYRIKKGSNLKIMMEYSLNHQPSLDINSNIQT